MIWDLAICGGGPAGLAVAIHAARAGFSAVVLERSPGATDKACGEGLMPRGLQALRRLGVLEELTEGQRAPFRGIRYVQEDGAAVEARFRGGEGLGIRRTALSQALRARAAASGAELRTVAVRSFRVDGVARLETDGGPVEARLAVAADGLHSPLRRAAGLDGAERGPRRFGLRRHFRLAPWSDLVEVHWTEGVEGYVTPVGPACVNVAFLWQEDAFEEKASFESMMARFPALGARVGAAPVESESRGAGPFQQAVRARAASRLALVGDAAGYVDAITGQGLSLAFTSAEFLVRALPRPIAEPQLARALRRYDASLRGEWLRYAVPARALLAASRLPRWRQRGLRLLQRHPSWFGLLLRAVA
jgi:flavin-dependent dehydrogenase